MTSDLRKRALELVARSERVVMATCGPAGAQASHVGCRLRKQQLDLFLPGTSDHLFNLETHPELVVLAHRWVLDGYGRVLEGGAGGLEAPWRVTVRVEIDRLHILKNEGTEYAQSIDFNRKETP